MLRSLFAIAAIFCTTVVLAEAIAAGMLWFNGSLNRATLHEVRQALQGTAGKNSGDVDAEQRPQAPSHGEVLEARLSRILQLNARESELNILKRMTSDTANQLISDRQAFDQLKQEFREELQKLEEQNRSEATEQTRTILLATAPEDAVQRLMALTPQEAVALIRGLPEKNIARILQAFQTDPNTAKRGQELFESLYRGDPSRSLIQNTLEQIDSRDSVSRRGG